MDFTWLGLQICICRSQIQYLTKKKVGEGIRKPVSIWCDHHLPHAARHHLLIELIRMLIVVCGILSHFSPMASCWILAGTGTHCRTRRSRAAQTCSMGDMSGQYAGVTFWPLFPLFCLYLVWAGRELGGAVYVCFSRLIYFYVLGLVWFSIRGRCH